MKKPSYSLVALLLAVLAVQMRAPVSETSLSSREREPAQAALSAAEKAEAVRVGRGICGDETEEEFVAKWNAADQRIKDFLAKPQLAGQMITCALAKRSTWRLEQLSRLGLITDEAGRQALITTFNLADICDKELAAAHSLLFPAVASKLHAYAVAMSRSPHFRGSPNITELKFVPFCIDSARALETPEAARAALTDGEFKNLVLSLAK